MQTITTVSIAQSNFQVHGVDAEGHVVIRRQLSVVTWWRSSRSCRHAWLASRLVPRRITGRASPRRWGIP